MRNWIYSIQSAATVLVFSGVATVFLLCGTTANSAQEVRPSTEKPNLVRVAENQSLVVDESLERSAQFQKLIEEWHEQRGAMSWATDISMCPAYQSIIGRGPSVIPLILAQLESEGDEPDHWFWALRVITGVNPIAEQDQGNVIKMSKAWLLWGAQEGYVS